MPISLTIDNSSSETVNLIEFSTPIKTLSNQFNYEKTDDISSFNFKDSKIQSSTPICIKHNTPTQNYIAAVDSIELGLQSTMNNEDNSSILNSKADEKASSDNIMYLIPKEPQVDQKDGSSYSKSSKLLTKVLGDSEEILRYDRMRKKIKCGKGSSYIFTEYKKVCADLQVKVLIKKQEFKEELRSLETKVTNKK